MGSRQAFVVLHDGGTIQLWHVPSGRPLFHGIAGSSDNIVERMNVDVRRFRSLQ
jgi:hypothetical protein